MGVLLEPKFWAQTLNQMAELKPKLGQAVSREDAVRIHAFACRTFSTLTVDPDFPGDLEKALRFAPAPSVLNFRARPNYKLFLDRFMSLELKILKDAGVNSVASRDLENALRETAMGNEKYTPDELKKMIEFLQELACNPNAAENPERPLWSALCRAIRGAAAVGIDAGAGAAGTVALPPIGGAILSLTQTSVAYGLILVRDALRGRW